MMPVERLSILVFATLVATSAAAQTIDQLCDAARQEGALVFYGGGPAAQYEPWAKEFEQRFPGIKVTVKAGSSNVLADEIDTQMKAGALQVDLAALQTIQDYERWKAAGQLLRFKLDGFDRVDAEWKDRDGAYVGITVYGLSYGYNTAKVTGDAVPRAAPDFLKPAFRGRIIAGAGVRARPSRRRARGGERGREDAHLRCQREHDARRGGGRPTDRDRGLGD